MKLLSQAEFATLNLKSRGNMKYAENKFKVELDKLDVGESIFIETDEWDRHGDPSKSVNSWFKKKNGKKLFTSRTLVDESGWVVTRIR